MGKKIVFFLLCFCCFSQAAAAKHIVAVCTVNSMNQPGVTEFFESRIISALSDTPSFQVVERERLGYVLREYRLQRQGMTTYFYQTLNRVLGAEYVIFADCSFSVTENNIISRSSAVAMVQLRMVDAANNIGNVVAAVYGSGTVNPMLTTPGWAVEIAARNAADNLARLFPVFGRVIGTEGNHVYISLTLRDSIRKGDKIKIFADEHRVGNNKLAVLGEPIIGKVVAANEDYSEVVVNKKYIGRIFERVRCCKK